MSRVRGICLIVLLVLAASLLSLPWWGEHAQTLLAQGTPGPGLTLEIQDVSISGERRPVVTFRIADGQGNPLELTDLDANSVRFTIARLDTDPNTGLTSYSSYVLGVAAGRPFQFEGVARQPALATAIQAVSAADSTGTFQGLGNGVHRYTFRTVLPEDFPRDVTHALGAQATRNARAFADNEVRFFVPDGSASPITRQVVSTAACNQCHDPLRAHGGQRVEVDLCVQCHTPQTIDPESGNTVDFKVLIHKLHSGPNLPSAQAGVEYIIVGNNQNVFDPSEIEFPQNIRNCTTCHADAPQADNWRTAPSNAACTSCHDDTNALTGQNHVAGPQPDSACKTCHAATAARDFDPSVPGAHVLPTRASALRGVEFNLVSASNTGPGQSPTVIFNIKDKAGATIAPSEMTALRLMVAGPTTDYQTTFQEVATGATDAGGGNFSYTFTARIPGSAAGTFAIGIEGYIQTTIPGQTETVRDAGFNEVLYVSVTDPVPLPRKTIVSRDRCNECHEDLGNPAGISIHGGSRNNTQYCILCHNPNGTDISRRPADQLPPESIHFKKLIHRIHTGEEGEEPYIIYGFGGSRNDFSGILYPGDRRNCTKCHLPGSQLVNFLHEGSVPTVIRQDSTVVSSVPPITTACTACHDSDPARQHAGLNTTEDGIETCIICHGEGRDFAVSEAHARP